MAQAGRRAGDSSGGVPVSSSAERVVLWGDTGREIVELLKGLLKPVTFKLSSGVGVATLEEVAVL